MNYKTAIGRFFGFGTAGGAHNGSAHWFSERLGAVVMIPLSLGAVVIIAPLLGQPHGVVIASLARPMNAITLMAFLLLCSRHLADGLQTIIEDYIHDRVWFARLLFINRLGCWSVGLLGVFSIAKIALGG